MIGQLGRYTLEERIAVGGMAEIFRARSGGDGKLEKILTIKVLREHLAKDPRIVEMFINEARLGVQLNHKNICQTFDLEEVDGRHFIAMELIEGRQVSEVIERFRVRNELMPIELALYITQEICSGLSYAHRKRGIDGEEMLIIHQDMTPENVLISFEGEVKIIDFGIAESSTNNSEVPTEIRGKFRYMSPEQARGEIIDQRTDIFATGAMLFEMVTGRPIYPENLPEEELLVAVRRAQHLKPRQALADIPEPLEKIILKALARQPVNRFPNAHDFQVAVTRYLYVQENPCDSMRLSQVMGRLFGSERNITTSTVVPIIDLKAFSAPSSSRVELLDSLEQQAAEGIVHPDSEALGIEMDNLGPASGDFEIPDDAATIARSRSEKWKMPLQSGMGALSGGSSPLRPVGELRRAALPTMPEIPILDLTRRSGVSAKYKAEGFGANKSLDGEGFGEVITDGATQFNMSTLSSPNALRPKGGKAKWIILAVLVLVLIVGATLGALQFTTKKLEKAPPPPEPVKMVQVSVRSIPSGALIYIDDKSTDQKTPVMLKVEEGDRTLRLEYPEYKTSIEKIEATEGKKLKFSLLPKSWGFRLKVQPFGASILIDGRKEIPKEARENCPMTACFDGLTLDRRIRISISKNGFLPSQREISWLISGERVLDVFLQLVPETLPREISQSVGIGAFKGLPSKQIRRRAIHSLEVWHK